MRVISGRFKGHVLFAPKGRALRPTSDQVKETLFNMLGRHILEARFLDLFAGTGNVGIEALSRGAECGVFVEKHPKHLQMLKRNLTACGIEHTDLVYCGDANKVLKALQKQQRQFDIVFLDPPYRQTNMLCDIMQRVVETRLIAAKGCLIIEHIHTFLPPANPGASFSLTKQRRIGDTTLSFYSSEL